MRSLFLLHNQNSDGIIAINISWDFHMVKWFDVNLNWTDIKTLDVVVGKTRNERVIVLNGVKYTSQMLKKNKPSSMTGTRMHLFGLDFVIKVDSPCLYRSWGMDEERKQSNVEFNIWNSLKKRDRKYFAEVLDYKEDSHIVFKRYPEIDDMNHPKQKIYKKFCNKINKLIDTYQLCDIDTDIWNRVTETHNWAMVGGQPLIFDYGFSMDDTYQ